MTAFEFESFEQPVNVMIQGASRGIGAGFVEALLASSSVARIVATCRNPAEAASLQAARERASGKLVLTRLDVEDESSVEAAADEVGGALDALHVIVNCAGLLHDGQDMQPERRLSEIEPRNLQRSFAVNALGPLLVAKHFARLLPRRDRAIFASLSARVGSIGDNRRGGWYGYRAAKAAQNMFTRSLSIEIPRKARRTLVVALHPGTVDTGLSEPFQDRVPDEQLFDVALAVRQLLAVMDGLGENDNGGFFAWDGERIPW